MNLHQKKSWYRRWPVLVACALAAVSIFILLPIKIPFDIDTIGKVVPSKVWYLSKAEEGRITSTLFDYERGVPKSYSVVQFARGDAISLSIDGNVQPGTSIATGDTICSIFSIETERKMIKLESDIGRAAAALQLNMAGAKRADVEKAEKRLSYAKKAAEAQRKVIDRLRKLYENNLISKQELEVQEGDASLSDINIAIAEAEYKSVSTGSQQERIEVLMAKIAGLEKELSLFQRKTQQYIFTSPFAGRINSISVGDTLLTIDSASSFVVMLPIELKYRKYVQPSQKVVCVLTNEGRSVTAEILRIEQQARTIQGKQVFMAIALVEKDAGSMLPGLFTKCRVVCSGISPMEYLKLLTRTIANS